MTLHSRNENEFDSTVFTFVTFSHLNYDVTLFILTCCTQSLAKGFFFLSRWAILSISFLINLTIDLTVIHSGRGKSQIYCCRINEITITCIFQDFMSLLSQKKTQKHVTQQTARGVEMEICDATKLFCWVIGVVKAQQAWSCNVIPCWCRLRFKSDESSGNVHLTTRNKKTMKAVLQTYGWVVQKRHQNSDRWTDE